LGTWNWLIFGFILMALELLAPGVFMFWLGLAALLVGLLSFAINPSWQTQLLMFAVFAVAAVPAWRHFARSEGSRSASNPFLNKRTERWSDANSPWKSRSSMAPARCGSTTRSGASPAPTHRPAAASRSCRPMVPA
jgi:hypothetical protein